MESRFRAPVTMLVMLALLLAGCTTGPSNDPGPIVITDPDDFSYAQNNTSMTDRPHIHDYWDGQERLEVMDYWQVRSSTLYTDDDRYRLISFSPPDGRILPLGTEKVEVTVSWEDESPTRYRLGDEPMELWVKTAADNDAQPFVQLKNGETVVFPTTNEQNDIPHQRLSAWELVIAVPSAIEGPLAHQDSHSLKISVRAEAVRGLEIPPYPAHPDLWDNADELPLAEAARSYHWTDAFNSYWKDDAGCLFCGGFTEITPDDGLIVPHDANHVRVEMDVDADTPDGIHLMYHGADSWTWKDAPKVEDGDMQIYTIPVDGDGDSPYALQSLWSFSWRVDRDEPPYESRGNFQLNVTVHKEPAP